MTLLQLDCSTRSRAVHWLVQPEAAFARPGDDVPDRRGACDRFVTGLRTERWRAEHVQAAAIGRGGDVDDDERCTTRSPLSRRCHIGRDRETCSALCAWRCAAARCSRLS